LATVAAVYTGRGLAESILDIFTEVLPECRLVNLIDDSIILDVIQEGRVTRQIIRRLVQYFQIAQDMGADIILNTCSSVGEIVSIGEKLVDIPIVRIDEPMAEKAVQSFQRIGVLATVPSTLEPTIRLIQSKAKILGKSIRVHEGLAEGAYQSLIDGDPSRHDELILETATEIAPEVDGIVLAQGTMMRMEKTLQERAQKPVLSSPYLGILAVKSKLSSRL
jgi:aspartate/glutamate racemase